MEEGEPLGVSGFGSGTRDLFGQFGVMIGVGGVVADATAPIPGTGWIVELILLVGRQLVGPSQGVFRLAWVDAVPTSVADVNAGERVFSQLNRGQSGANTFTLSSDMSPLVLGGPFKAEPRGRRLGATFSNAGVGDAWMLAYLLWERCSASGKDGDAGLGACWS